MHEIPIILDLVIIFGLAIPVIYVCHRLNIPVLVGLLLTGIMIGPNALLVIENQHEVELLAEIGVILLLFAIGLEFSLARLARIRKVVLFGGTVQVLSAIAITTGLGYSYGLPLNQSIFIGFLLALSSTAIVLKMMQERGELNTPHGQNMLGILIYQDIAIVPLILLVPFLGGTGSNLLNDLLTLVGAGLFTVGVVIVLARYVVPYLLYWIAGTRQQELFLISIVFLGLLVCWFTFQLGLSLSLGAFLAGLIISESEYSHEAIAHIIPFRDVFTSLFFVSMGILLNPRILVQYPLVILGFTILAMAIGTFTSGLAISLLGFPLSVVATVAVGLNQIGEFSLILSKVGLEYDLLSLEYYQLFLAVAILSMMITPFEYRLIARFSHLFSQNNVYQLLGLSGRAREHELLHDDDRNDHLIVVGYGPTGQTLVNAAEQTDIPYVILELNPKTVYRQREEGRPIKYGDAGKETVLENLNVRQARCLAITISDQAASRRIIAQARRMNPNLYIVSRARFIRDVESLRDLGANTVVPEERETSMEIFVRILQQYLVPEETISSLVEDVRERFEGGIVHSGAKHDIETHPPELSPVNVTRYHVPSDSPLVEQTLEQLKLPKQWGVTVGAVERNGGVTVSPPSEFQLQSGDVLILIGETPDIQRFTGEISKNPPPE